MQIDEFKKIISLAISNEVAAFEFYFGVSEATKDKVLKLIFKELADEEQRHRESLQGCLAGNKPVKLSRVRDYKISQQVDKPKLSLRMKPIDAVALAMKEEEEAMDMYESLAEITEEPEQKAMFLALAKMERGHKVKLEDLYSRLVLPEAW